MGKRGRGQPRSGQAAGGNRQGQPGQSAGPIGLALVAGRPEAFELVHPRCVEEMKRLPGGSRASGRQVILRRRHDALRYTLQAGAAGRADAGPAEQGMVQINTIIQYQGVLASERASCSAPMGSY